MKILIVKTSNPTYWYANKIGEVFETSGRLDGDDDYRVEDCRDGAGYPRYVAAEDCEIVEEAEGMGKVTMLTDELGLQREYREVKREAEEGERVKIIAVNPGSRKFGKVFVGEIFTAAEVDYVGDIIAVSERRFPGIIAHCWTGFGGEYVVLEPTDIIHVNGERFRAVDRKANVGERIIIVREEHPRNGGVYTVSCIASDGDVNFLGDYYAKDGWYRVLEPLGSAPDTSQPNISEQPDVADLVRKSDEQQAQIDGLTETVANLARRVADLERGQVPNEAPEPVVEKTLTRDEVIEKAKMDVAELKRIGGDRYGTLPPTSSLCGKYYNVKFQINRKKKTVVALVYGGNSRTLYSRGIAKCAPGDVFNVYIGMAIALRRALGLDIPQEYGNAPQPDEARVGDYVEYAGYVVKVEPPYVDTELPYNYSRGTCAVRSFVACSGRIIDDSRDGRYGEVYSV